jgi:hypothetical protein
MRILHLQTVVQFTHMGLYDLLFSEALTICRLEVQVFSHDNRYVLGSCDGGGRAVIYYQ